MTNGLGGYASGTLAGVATRRFHSVLTASLSAPRGRYVMLNKLTELITVDHGTTYRLGGKDLAKDGPEQHGAGNLREFRLELGIPTWRYQLGEVILEKRILMPFRQNTVHISYRLVQGEAPVRLKIRLGMHIRAHEASLGGGYPEGGYAFHASGEKYEILAPAMPPVRFRIVGARGAFTVEGQRFADVRYRVEESLGYKALSDLWCPGYFRVDLSPDHETALVISMESWEIIRALDPSPAYTLELGRRQRLITLAHPALRQDPAAHLVVAADQFIVKPAERVAESTRAQAAGDEIRTIIAGYHWFTDWGRDTMISLEGLTLVTGRGAEAAYILLAFARHVQDGLIPNMFPEGSEKGVYHTADATLWFFHALDRYVQATGDRILLRRFLPLLVNIVEKHVAGTRFGIGVDPADGLLRQGDPQLPLTWMDARMRDWVVTPRRGKAVEINALWYNAVSLLSGWLKEEGQTDPGEAMAKLAGRARQSFNQRFWNEEKGYLFDVVDGEQGNDPACRPNQIFAVSLPHAVLAEDRWPAVLATVRQKLLTPFGLRTLSAAHPEYKADYKGDLRTRDGSYHQGTVWPWLIGPFIDAWLKVYPQERAQARQMLHDLLSVHLKDACIGSISEIFDAEPPFLPRGCISQAWSVAEVLRCWAKTAEEANQPG